MDAGRSATVEATDASPRALRGSRTVLALFLIAVGLTVPRVAGPHYPFARFHMFSQRWTTAPRLVVRDSGGGIDEVDAWAAWDCPEKVDLMRVDLCDDGSRHPEEAHKASDFINSRQRPLPAGTPVEVIRRLYSFPRPGGPPAVEDCVLLRCKASRRSGDGT